VLRTRRARERDRRQVSRNGDNLSVMDPHTPSPTIFQLFGLQCVSERPPGAIVNQPLMLSQTDYSAPHRSRDSMPRRDKVHLNSIKARIRQTLLTARFTIVRYNNRPRAIIVSRCASARGRKKKDRRDRSEPTRLKSTLNNDAITPLRRDNQHVKGRSDIFRDPSSVRSSGAI